jgi:O-acetyl-ADP-ribose deacetylase (regulator of RNase III)
MTVEITKGDLLEQRVDAIVNTVNTVGVMGKGIALQFRRKWPANYKDVRIRQRWARRT